MIIKILAETHQIELRLCLALGTKTLHFARILDKAMISIPFNEICDCRVIAVSDIFVKVWHFLSSLKE